MVEHGLVSISISAVVILGIAAQWMGWRLRFPSILLLLIFGILAGPVFGWINPDELLGPLLSAQCIGSAHGRHPGLLRQYIF